MGDVSQQGLDGGDAGFRLTGDPHLAAELLGGIGDAFGVGGQVPVAGVPVQMLVGPMVGAQRRWRGLPCRDDLHRERSHDLIGRRVLPRLAERVGVGPVHGARVVGIGGRGDHQRREQPGRPRVTGADPQRRVWSRHRLGCHRDVAELECRPS